MALSTDETDGNWTLIAGPAADVVSHLNSNDIGPTQIVNMTHNGSSGDVAVLYQP